MHAPAGLICMGMGMSMSQEHARRHTVKGRDGRRSYYYFSSDCTDSGAAAHDDLVLDEPLDDRERKEDEVERER